ncbi:MAG: hypothetical protein WCV92_03640 [Candidatus Buchananbacteria bacterium]
MLTNTEEKGRNTMPSTYNFYFRVEQREYHVWLEREDDMKESGGQCSYCDERKFVTTHTNRVVEVTDGGSVDFPLDSSEGRLVVEHVEKQRLDKACCGDCYERFLREQDALWGAYH